MGLFSSSKSSSATTNNTSNIGFSDVDGPAVHGSNNRVNITDLGAVREGAFIAREGLRIADNAIEETVFLSRDLIAEQRGLAETALSINRDTFQDSLNFADNILTTQRDTTTDALDFVGGLAERQASDLSTFVRDQNETTDQRIERIAGWGFLALVTAVGVNAYMTQRKRAA